MTSRRAVLLAAPAGAVGAAVGGVAGHRWRAERVRYPLLSATVAITGTATRSLVGQGSRTALVAGTRVACDAPDAGALTAAGRTWSASSAEWTRSPGRWSGLVQSALLDLRSLTLPGGVAVAGWSPAWRYVWPRDASFVAAALAAAGHGEDAVAVLRHIQALQHADGWFEARYRIDGPGSPDSRPPQLDGTGWVVWAVAEVVRGLPAGAADEAATALAPMVRRSVGLILRETGGPSGLPAPSPDYWEVPETSRTLGTAAPLLAGLSAAPALLARVGGPTAAADHRLAARAATGATRLAAAIRVGFGADGYPRHLHGHDGDAAVTFLLPPFAAAADPAVVAVAGERAEELRRPSGGVAPGSTWRADGASWTPETALFALTAAATGDTARAAAGLGWLADHRTTRGSLPEMVRYDGRPASVAPLAWTAALAVLTAAHLTR